MRLKKLLKASLIVALFSSIAMAASATEKKVSVYGNFDYWYGQYSNSESVTAREEDGSTASETAAKDSYMRDFWQVVSGLRANSGDASANVWFLRRGYFTGNELAFKGWAKYQLADKLSVRAGNSIAPAGTVGATATSGLSTSLTFGMGIIHGFLAYVDSTGIEVEYKLNNYFGIYLDLFSRDPMYQKSVQGVDGRGVLTKLATKGIVCSTCDLKYLYPKDHSFDDMDTSTFQKTGETSK